MKLLLKTLWASFLLVSVGMVMPSCEPEKNEEPAIVGTTIFVPAESNSSITVKIIMEDNWQVRNSLQWLHVSPLSGLAGEAELTIKTLEANGSIYEKEGFIDIIQGEPVRYNIVQEGKSGVELIKEKMLVKAEAGEYIYKLNTNAEISATLNVDWATVSRIDYNLDSTLLADETNYSKVRPAQIVLDVQENISETEKRNAKISIECGEEIYEVELVQSKKINIEADWSKMFYKMSLGIRFTGSGCGWCPYMNQAFKDAVAERPDRMEILNIHGYNTSDPLYYKDSGKFAKFYGVQGYPTGVFNSMVIIQNNPDNNKTQVVNLIDEAVEKYPAKSAIIANSELNGDELSISAVVATKEANNYKIHIFLVENGYEGTQSGVSGTYQFDHFMRMAITDHFGDVLEDCGDETFVSFEKTITIPAGTVFDYEKSYLLIFTTYKHEGKPEGTVRGVTYKDFGMIVDNVITCPLNGETQIKYEN